jgi:hypothetical protein
MRLFDFDWFVFGQTDKFRTGWVILRCFYFLDCLCQIVDFMFQFLQISILWQGLVFLFCIFNLEKV